MGVITGVKDEFDRQKKDEGADSVFKDIQKMLKGEGPDARERFKDPTKEMKQEHKYAAALLRTMENGGPYAGEFGKDITNKGVRVSKIL